MKRMTIIEINVLQPRATRKFDDGFFKELPFTDVRGNA